MFKLGRTPRGRDPKVCHYSSLVADKALPAPPASVNYSHGMPANIGMMLNDQLGDCTCADIGHSIQVWSYNSHGKMLTLPDAEILAFYEKICGYIPGQPATDQGGNMQVVRNYIQQHGIPIPGTTPAKVLLWVEVDKRNHDDVKRVIDECGGCSIGFNVPQYILPDDGSPPPRQWVLQPSADNSIIGGHDVYVVGYDAHMLTLASWGGWYQMGWSFWDKFVDEAYGTACDMWVKATGKTPAGLTVQQLEKLMNAMKA